MPIDKHGRHWRWQPVSYEIKRTCERAGTMGRIELRLACGCKKAIQASGRGLIPRRMKCTATHGPRLHRATR